jgi:hypothetical protein
MIYQKPMQLSESTENMENRNYKPGALINSNRRYNRRYNRSRRRGSAWTSQQQRR